MESYESPRIVELGTLSDLTRAFRGGPDLDANFSNPAERGGRNEDLAFTS